MPGPCSVSPLTFGSIPAQPQCSPLVQCECSPDQLQIVGPMPKIPGWWGPLQARGGSLYSQRRVTCLWSCWGHCCMQTLLWAEVLPSCSAGSSCKPTGIAPGPDLSAPSVCHPGWYPEVKCSFNPCSLPREQKKWDTNSVPQSEVTCPGQCLANMWVRKSLVSWGELMVLWVRMNRACLVSLSMITRIAVNPSNTGSCSMKSMDMESQG